MKINGLAGRVLFVPEGRRFSLVQLGKYQKNTG